MNTDAQRRWPLWAALGALGLISTALLWALYQGSPRSEDAGAGPASSAASGPSTSPAHAAPRTEGSAHPRARERTPPKPRGARGPKSSLSPASPERRATFAVLTRRAKLLARVATLRRRRDALEARLAEAPAGQRLDLEEQLKQLDSALGDARRELKRPLQAVPKDPARSRKRGPLGPRLRSAPSPRRP